MYGFRPVGIPSAFEGEPVRRDCGPVCGNINQPAHADGLARNEGSKPTHHQTTEIAFLLTTNSMIDHINLGTQRRWPLLAGQMMRSETHLVCRRSLVLKYVCVPLSSALGRWSLLSIIRPHRERKTIEANR